MTDNENVNAYGVVITLLLPCKMMRTTIKFKTTFISLRCYYHVK